MFWSEQSYVEYSTTYVGFSTLHRKSAFLHRIKISWSAQPHVHMLPSNDIRRVSCIECWSTRTSIDTMIQGLGFMMSLLG